MNERIDQLWAQALDAAAPETYTQLSHSQVLKIKQVFAQLIVQECGNWFNSRLVVEPDYGLEHRIERNRAVVGVMKEFNTHFGVDQ